MKTIGLYLKVFWAIIQLSFDKEFREEMEWEIKHEEGILT